MRFLVFLLTIICACSPTAEARGTASSSISLALEMRQGWVDQISEVQAAIAALPAGPTKDYVQDAWSVFMVAWSAADQAAGTFIDLALLELANGNDAAALQYAQSAIQQLGLLDFHYEIFAMTCQAAGWTPPSL